MGDSHPPLTFNFYLLTNKANEEHGYTEHIHSTQKIMEELIYLAVVIGWFLLNAFKKSQAKKQQQAEGRQRNSETFDETVPKEQNTMEELLRQLMGEEAPAPVAVPKPAAPKPEPQVAASVSPQPRTSKLTPRTSKRRDRTTDRTSPVSEERTTTTSLTDGGFNLREAIIYDAILQRPYA